MDKIKKQAVLVVSFGTSHEETRKITIDATEAYFEEQFSDYDVFRAFTSPTIIRVLNNRDNIQVNNVIEALDFIKSLKYEKVIVQSLHVINGYEYDDMYEIVHSFKDNFEELSIGAPLLTSDDDFRKTIDALSTQFAEKENDEAVIFVGHGTHHKSNSVYQKLEETFKLSNYKNIFVGTIDGDSTFENTLEKLRINKIKKVILMPMLIVAGDHAKNDIAGDNDDSWKSKLTKEGFDVRLYLHGIGENVAIRDIFISHAKDAIQVK